MFDFNATAEHLAIKMKRQGPSYPFADEDYDCFHRRKLEIMTVELTAEIRAGIMNEAKIFALDANGQHIEVLIAGERAREYRAGLGQRIEDAMHARIRSGNDCPARELRVEVEITGTMTEKRWTDSHGKRRSIPKIVAAQWSYDLVEITETTRITEGRLPSSHYAEGPLG